jgi:hypothetical protein
MSSDINGTSIAITNGTVVAIQGNAVNSASLGSKLGLTAIVIGRHYQFQLHQRLPLLVRILQALKA